MSEALDYHAATGIFSEVYEVERTVIVVMNARTFRLEVLKGYSNPNVPYSVRCWISEQIRAQHSYPRDEVKGKMTFGRKPEDVEVWTAYHLPWVARTDSESALRQALGFLAEQHRDE